MVTSFRMFLLFVYFFSQQGLDISVEAAASFLTSMLTYTKIFAWVEDRSVYSAVIYGYVAQCRHSRTENMPHKWYLWIWVFKDELSNSRYGKGCYCYQRKEYGFYSVHLHIELMENRWPIYGSWVLKDIFTLMMFPLMVKMNHLYYLRKLSAASDTWYAWLTLTVFAPYNVIWLEMQYNKMVF